MNDWQLLEAYARERSEAAFETLVKRHLDLVHSVALRQVRSPELAQEVTQAVFLLLARKSAGLRNVVLTGWLFRTTRFIAARALRAEFRRQRREHEAAAMTPTSIDPQTNDSSWQQIEPLLDSAVAELSEADRHVVLLRFYRRLPLAEVGGQLGVSEDAAKKRVSRAVEKLRAIFARRKVTLPAATLLAVISERAVAVAPAALAGGISAALNAGATTAASSFAGQLVAASLRAMFWRKLRLGFGLGVAALALMPLGRMLWPSHHDDATTRTASTPRATKAQSGFRARAATVPKQQANEPRGFQIYAFQSNALDDLDQRRWQLVDESISARRRRVEHPHRRESSQLRPGTSRLVEIDSADHECRHRPDERLSCVRSCADGGRRTNRGRACMQEH